MTAIAAPYPAATDIPKFLWMWRGHRIAWTRAGAGTPLVLVHGFGASIGHWRKNIPALAAAGYEVFALDLLGFGDADKPALPYSLNLWEDLLRDFWAAHIGRPAVFVGNSIGGLLSLMVASRQPAIVLGSVLLNPAGGLNHRPEELPPLLRWVMGAFTSLVASPQVGGMMFDFIRQRQRIRRTLYQVYRDRTAVTDELVEMLYRPSCDVGAQQVFASILTAPAGPKPADLLEALDRPLLVLWGDADPWTPIDGAKPYHAMRDRKDIEIMAIANAGHCPHDERPEEVNGHILGWLERKEIAKAGGASMRP